MNTISDNFCNFDNIKYAYSFILHGINVCRSIWLCRMHLFNKCFRMKYTQNTGDILKPAAKRDIQSNN